MTGVSKDSFSAAIHKLIGGLKYERHFEHTKKAPFGDVRKGAGSKASDTNIGRGAKSDRAQRTMRTLLIYEVSN